jgi:hypothetical protein
VVRAQYCTLLVSLIINSSSSTYNLGTLLSIFILTPPNKKPVRPADGFLKTPKTQKSAAKKKGKVRKLKAKDF